ncbi:dynamin family protein [Desulfobotulus mexicanus]|uniref:Dynamin N-terminal domain-containing protein n=1 Tax=Desulfobotulus mexicanus TaxID=2586642 RepID=A0A5S5MFG8_9BACT|nr:dynamin family protein [Desulfobotulus mexicanus]TYT74463.1 hypothetical protein FIM25_09935 [Desulfobotulus mexicanus]
MNELSLEKRYELVCNAITRPETEGKTAASLSSMEKALDEEMLKITRHHSPPDFVHLYFNFRKEFDRFREFARFPELSTKNTVGFGGAFSAGKSTLINALLDKKALLPAETDPTTTVPVYLMQGEEEKVHAINLFGHSMDLSTDDFVVLTHDFEKEYGRPLGHMLKSAHIALPEFAWDNLALLDTPGYSNAEDTASQESTDAKVARSQLNGASFIVWVVSAKAGTIPENDLRFIATLRPETPKLFVVSRADYVPEEDIQAIVDLVRKTLQSRGIAFVDVVPYSSKKKKRYPKEAITTHFDRWNQSPAEVLFARNFKVLFAHFIRYLDERRRDTERSLNRLNRILAISEESDITEDVKELKTRTIDAHKMLVDEKKTLLELSARFFRELKDVGDLVGIKMPEPSEMDLLEGEGIILLDMLLEIKKERGKKDRDMARFFLPLQADAESEEIPYMIHRRARTLQSTLKDTLPDGRIVYMEDLLQRRGKSLQGIFKESIPTKGLPEKLPGLTLRRGPEYRALIQEFNNL